MSENFVYRYGDNLYVNLTNKCCNDCTFCIRNNGDGIGDSGDLWLSREPSSDEVIEAIKRHGEYVELVFCGYGEPTYKTKEMSMPPVLPIRWARRPGLIPTDSAIL